MATKGPCISYFSLPDSLHNTRAQKTFSACSQINYIYNLFIFFFISHFRGTNMFFSVSGIYNIYIFLGVPSLSVY